MSAPTQHLHLGESVLVGIEWGEVGAEVQGRGIVTLHVSLAPCIVQRREGVDRQVKKVVEMHT